MNTVRGNANEKWNPYKPRRFHQMQIVMNHIPREKVFRRICIEYSVYFTKKSSFSLHIFGIFISREFIHSNIKIIFGIFSPIFSREPNTKTSLGVIENKYIFNFFKLIFVYNYLSNKYERLP